MTPDYTDILRRLLNLVCPGTIAEIDYDRQLARVRVGKNLTDWRPWLTVRAGTTRTWLPPSVGEQVVLLSPEGDFDKGYILPGLYSETFYAPCDDPHTDFLAYPDGTLIQYN